MSTFSDWNGPQSESSPYLRDAIQKVDRKVDQHVEQSVEHGEDPHGVKSYVDPKFNGLSAGMSANEAAISGLESRVDTAETAIEAVNNKVGVEDGYIDHKKWALINARAVYSGNKYYHCIGRLSNKWVEDIKLSKACRVFLKFVDTFLFDAIIDITACDNTQANMIVNIATQANNMPEVTFTITKTTDENTTDAYYLWLSGDQLNYDLTSVLRVFGENFIPNELPTVTFGASICEVTCSGTGTYVSKGLSVNGVLEVEAITTDTVKDSLGHDIVHVDATTEPDTVKIGNKTDKTVIESAARPKIVLANGNEKDIAFIEDMGQSIYWQRSVDVCVDTVDDLDKLTVDTVGGRIVTKGTEGAVAVPGIYTSDAKATQPTGKIFNNTTIALVQRGIHLKLENLVDTDYSAEFSGNKPYIESRYVDRPDRLHIGAIVKNVEGKYAKLTAGPFTQDDFYYYESEVVPKGFTLYMPSYYKYNKDNDKWDLVNDVTIPATSDNVLTWATYEWEAFVDQHDQHDESYYTMSYVKWTPANTTNVSLPEWDTEHLPFELFRTAAQQDIIDFDMLTVTGMQADFADTNEVVRSGDQYIPNPAYVQNKPWVGVAELEPGTFLTSDFAVGFMVDGGNFTGASDPVGDTPVSIGYKNAIIHVWHGGINEMPDATYDTETDTFTFKDDPALVARYTRTLRWCDDAKRMFFSDGAIMRELGVSSTVNVDINSGHVSTGIPDENLIYLATQYTSDMSEFAFDGTFYEIPGFLESEQIPSGAKLMYLDPSNDMLRFCSTLPPYSGLVYGSYESVTANKAWFENIVWLEGAIPVENFTYKTPTINVTDVGTSASVATQPVQAFVDYRQNAINNLLDLRSAETRDTLAKTDAKIGDLNELYTSDKSSVVKAINELVVEQTYDLIIDTNQKFVNWLTGNLGTPRSVYINTEQNRQAYRIIGRTDIKSLAELHCYRLDCAPNTTIEMSNCNRYFEGTFNESYLSKVCVSNINLLIMQTDALYVLAFENLRNLYNCTATCNVIGAAPFTGFHSCQNLHNCEVSFTPSGAMHGVGFDDCEYLYNCSVKMNDGPKGGAGYINCHYLDHCKYKGVQSIISSNVTYSGAGCTNCYHISNCTFELTVGAENGGQTYNLVPSEYSYGILWSCYDVRNNELEITTMSGNYINYSMVGAISECHGMICDNDIIVNAGFSGTFGGGTFGIVGASSYTTMNKDVAVTNNYVSLYMEYEPPSMYGSMDSAYAHCARMSNNYADMNYEPSPGSKTWTYDQIYKDCYADSKRQATCTETSTGGFNCTNVVFN